MQVSDQQLDALKEIINIGLGYGVNSLNTMLSSHIEMFVPDLKILDFDEMLEVVNQDYSQLLSTVNMGFAGPFIGSASLVFPKEDIPVIISSIMQEDEINDEAVFNYSNILTEVGNIVLNGILGTISNLFANSFDYSPPNYLEIKPEQLFYDMKKSNSVVIYAEAVFYIEKLNVKGNIIILLEIDSFEKLMMILNNSIDHIRG